MMRLLMWENVYKRLRENLKKDNRSYLWICEASERVASADFNSSLIIMASFLPLFFLDGMEGRILKLAWNFIYCGSL